MIRAGLVGSGFMGGTHAQCYMLMPGVELAAIASVDKETGPALAEKTGATLYNDFDAMAAAEKLDMADICIPTSMHADRIHLHESGRCPKWAAGPTASRPGPIEFIALKTAVAPVSSGTPVASTSIVAVTVVMM